MEYVMMLWPHANSRYQQSAARLAQSELGLILEKAGCSASIERENQGSMEWLTFQCPQLDERQLAMIGDLSLMYLLAERRSDGALMPVASRQSGALGDDLAGVLKYKGKTNELFTQMLINAHQCRAVFQRFLSGGGAAALLRSAVRQGNRTLSGSQPQMGRCGRGYG